ncbi:MAG: 4Fe-4S dicluster domain-containing protein [Candidatus Jordarchaeales archaeon]
MGAFAPGGLESAATLPKNILKYCMQCSLCSSVCPTARLVKEFNPRRIVWGAILGLEDDAVENGSVWFCLSCHLCSEVCPMKVKVSSLMTFFKNLLAERGKIPEGVLQEASMIFKTGRGVPYSPAVEKRRASLSLPPLPPVDIEEIKKLLGRLKLPIEGGEGK